MDKKKQPKVPAQLPADKPETCHSEDNEELYEQAPRQKTAETVKERERADLLPVKVNGELVYRRDAKTEHQSLPAVRTAPLSHVHALSCGNGEKDKYCWGPLCQHGCHACLYQALVLPHVVPAKRRI